MIMSLWGWIYSHTVSVYTCMYMYVHTSSSSQKVVSKHCCAYNNHIVAGLFLRRILSELMHFHEKIATLS